MNNVIDFEAHRKKRLPKVEAAEFICNVPAGTVIRGMMHALDGIYIATDDGLFKAENGEMVKVEESIDAKFEASFLNSFYFGGGDE